MFCILHCMLVLIMCEFVFHLMYIIKVSIRWTAANTMAYTIFKAHVLRGERGLLVVVLWGRNIASVTALINLGWNNFYK